MKLSKGKINKFNISCFGYAGLFIMYLPTFVTRIVDIPNWGVFCYLMILISDIYFIFRMKRITKPVWATALFFGYFLIITLFQNSNQLFNCLLRTYIAVSFALLMEYIFTKYDGEKSILILLRVMEVFNYLNLLSMICYPAGIYQVVGNGIYEQLVRVDPGTTRRTAARVIWLLGHQSLMIRFTLPSICIAMLCLCRKGARESRSIKLTIRSVLLIVVCLIETAVANSAGNYIFLVVFFALLILFKFKEGIKAQYFYIFIALSYFFLVSTAGNQSFYTFMSNILHRNVQISTRVPIWLNTVNAWMQKPIFGYGFIMDGIESIRVVMSAGNPHSSYLWVLYEGGIVGMIFMLLYFQLFAGQINNCWSSNSAKIIYAAFICLLVCMIDDDHMFRSQFYIIIFDLAYHIPDIANSNGSMNKSLEKGDIRRVKWQWKRIH